MARKFLWMAILFLFVMSCIRKNSTGPGEIKGTIQGFVKNANGAFIHPAYLISRDSLLATTDVQGKYTIASIGEGVQALTCSALNYRDTTLSIPVKGGQSVTADFSLARNSATGRV